MEEDEIINYQARKTSSGADGFRAVANLQKSLVLLWSDRDPMRRMKEGMDDVRAGRVIKIKGPTIENLLSVGIQ